MNERLKKLLSGDAFARDFAPVTFEKEGVCYFTFGEKAQVFRLSYNAPSDELRVITEVGELDPRHRVLCFDFLLAANFVPVGKRGVIFSYDRLSDKIFVADFTRWAPMDYRELLQFLQRFTQQAKEWMLVLQGLDFWEHLATSSIGSMSADSGKGSDSDAS